EIVGKHRSVGRLGAAVVERDQRNLVGSRLVAQRIGGRRAHGVVDRDLLAVLAFTEAFVALDAALGGPLGLALLVDQLDAIDAPLGLVQVGEVIDEPAPDRDAAGRIGTNPK